MIDVDAYPLQWPAGYPRTEEPKSARFKVEMAQARDELLDELRLMSADNAVISSDVRVRKDGLPYASFREPDDSGVAVYFVLGGQQTVMACDTWDKVKDNIRAIGLTIESMRAIDRHGVSNAMHRAFEGFKALPEQGSGPAWWDILDVRPNASIDDVRQAYRTRVKEVHPDAGGSAEAFHQVQEAFRQAIQAIENQED